MEIRWHGFSAFEVRTGASTVIFDPSPTIGARPARPDETLIVTASHRDRRLVDAEAWRGNAHVITGPGEYEISGLAIRGVPTPAGDPATGRSVNTVYLLDAERLTVCHLGRLAGRLTARAADLIGKVDVLIAPAGGENVISVEECAAVIRAIEPRLVIPMYFADGNAGTDSPLIARLVSEVGAPVSDPAPRLAVTRNNVPQELRIALLRPAG